VSHDDRLHQAYLAESIIARNRIGVGVEENAVSASSRSNLALTAVGIRVSLP
jgi:hypothetical protein